MRDFALRKALMLASGYGSTRRDLFDIRESAKGKILSTEHLSLKMGTRPKCEKESGVGTSEPRSSICLKMLVCVEDNCFYSC